MDEKLKKVFALLDKMEECAVKIRELNKNIEITKQRIEQVKKFKEEK